MAPVKVVIFGATGGLGQRVWRSAVDAGHQVVAFVRSPHKLDDADPHFAALEVVQGDVMDREAVQAAASGAEVVVNCTSPAGGNATIDLAKAVVTAAAAAGVERFYMVGGIGALWAPGTQKTVLLQDWDDPEAAKQYGLPPSIPRDMIRKMTRGHLASMEFLATTNLAHAFMCPGAMFDGPESPGRTVTLDELGGQGAMRVSYADIARVIVDDLNVGALLGHRVCVAPA